MRLRNLAMCLVVGTVFLAASRSAWAHAVLVASTPTAGATVPAGDLTVDLKFNSRVDGAHSTLSLVGPDGKAAELPLGTQVAPDEIRTHAAGLLAGSYTLRWQALSSDGHITRGQIAFQVK
jgi:methionine-rich copper-binding protein CopC